MATIISLNVSKTTGTDKEQVDSVTVKPDHGIVGDAHARNWHRQISLLAQESIAKMAKEHPDLGPGSFAENITTEGLDLPRLPIGTKLKIREVELEITQIGKKCHTKCKIYERAGSCIMPKEGIFAKVLTGGTLNAGDEIVVI
jgi:MOSC domain-containing protein YiiM